MKRSMRVVIRIALLALLGYQVVRLLQTGDFTWFEWFGAYLAIYVVGFIITAEIVVILKVRKALRRNPALRYLGLISIMTDVEVPRYRKWLIRHFAQ